MALLILQVLLVSFVQKWYIPCGSSAGCAGRVCIKDTDRDGNYEFFISYFSTSRKIYIYELHLPNTWEKDSFGYLYDPLLWDAGDFDLDGLYDLVIDASATEPFPTMVISIAESPDSFSYPTMEIWRDTVGFPLIVPICTYDIDKDGLPEIVRVIGDTTDFDIYESIDDNQYAKIFSDTIPEGNSPMSTLAFGDFDIDERNEFVLGYGGGEYSIWECTGDNMYQEIINFQQLPTVNIMDCFSVPDADQDGKMEFVIKGFWVSGTIDAFIFEAIADNTYEIIKTFSLPGGDYYGGYSDAGDVDGDSVPEIVLEAMYHVYIIKATGNDSFYIWDSLPGHGVGSNIRIFDVDNNGLNDIVVSGGNETRIYEYDAGAITENALHHTPNALRLTVSPNPFYDKIRIDFADKKTAMINVNVYDASGRLVKKLYQGTIAKNFPISWYGDDESGTSVSQGIYFLQITDLNNCVLSCRKIVKLK